MFTFSLVSFGLIMTRMSSAQQGVTSILISAFGALTGLVKSLGIKSRAALLAASRRIDRAGGRFDWPLRHRLVVETVHSYTDTK
jgi:hypothetical protein